MTRFPRILMRTGLATAAAAGLTLALTASASAHVTIRPDVNTSGSYAKITVRVPNESDTAGTTQIRLDLPADTPFPSVRVQPHPGWTAELTTEQLDEPVDVGDYTLEEAVTSVTWTADEGVRIGPDEFDEFALSVGPLPEPGTYLFPATQTYDDGEVVAWDMEPAEEEPSHPAPELTIVEGDEETGDAPHEDEDADASGEVDATDDLARGVGVGGVIIGAAGVGFGAAALRRRRA